MTSKEVTDFHETNSKQGRWIARTVTVPAKDGTAAPILGCAPEEMRGMPAPRDAESADSEVLRKSTR